eukprot:TRINITY_DN15767_c0_g1_i10.p3 TRINITY_DN15767_c0_g1~~TRINITY_DN15767_c0_g1_i10.p3  ORF type:complete len:190 (-),score=34.87 TRINITY_DN15767_c0_g1_i10:67-636(-)
MAIEIESELWKLFEKSDWEKYKQKSSTIISNLSNPQNFELRSDILKGVIKPSQLPALGPRELASKKLKEDRKQREEKYFKENVLLEGNAFSSTMIIKTKQGEKVISPQSRGISLCTIEDIIDADISGSGFLVSPTLLEQPRDEAEVTLQQLIAKLANRYKENLEEHTGKEMSEAVHKIGERIMKKAHGN